MNVDQRLRSQTLRPVLHQVMPRWKGQVTLDIGSQWRTGSSKTNHEPQVLTPCELSRFCRKSARIRKIAATACSSPYSLHSNSSVSHVNPTMVSDPLRSNFSSVPKTWAIDKNPQCGDINSSHIQGGRG